jgi:hypothetical protein
VRLVRLAPQAPLARKDRKETLVRLARPALLVLRETLALRGPRVQLDRPGRKALRDLLARAEDLAGGRSFRAAAVSWCRPVSAG